MQPHDPYMTPRAYWDRYQHERIDMPEVSELSEDPHSRRLYRMCRMDEHRITEAHVRNARHAYYGMIAYLDERLAALEKTVKEAGFGDETLWIVTSDHGDLLGEHGLWYKMHFFEHAVRVPLVLKGPGIPTGRVECPVSLLDLLPTLLDYASDGAPPEPVAPVDGHSLLASLTGDAGNARRAVVSEYLAEGAPEPMLMLRDGRYKYVCCRADAERLYDLESDPREERNVADDPRHAGALSELRVRADAHWDERTVKAAIVASQKRRRFAHQALQRGVVRSWDFQPYRDATRQYNRNIGGEIYDTDRRARIPYREAPDGGEG